MNPRGMIHTINPRQKQKRIKNIGYAIIGITLDGQLQLFQRVIFRVLQACMFKDT